MKFLEDHAFAISVIAVILSAFALVFALINRADATHTTQEYDLQSGTHGDSTNLQGHSDDLVQDILDSLNYGRDTYEQTRQRGQDTEERNSITGTGCHVYTVECAERLDSLD